MHKIVCVFQICENHSIVKYFQRLANFSFEFSHVDSNLQFSSVSTNPDGLNVGRHLCEGQNEVITLMKSQNIMSSLLNSSFARFLFIYSTENIG